MSNHYISETHPLLCCLDRDSSCICNNLVLFIPAFMKEKYIWNPQRQKSILIHLLFFLRFSSKTFYLPTPTALARPHSFYSKLLLMQTKSLFCLPQQTPFTFSVFKYLYSQEGCADPNCNDFSVLKNPMLYPQLFQVKFRESMCLNACMLKWAKLNILCIPKVEKLNVT